jgi:RNA polymerase sigma factor (sigma-70 family)
MTERIPPAVRAHIRRLFKEESPGVFKVALRAAGGDRGIADVAVQETFKAAALQWDEIADFDPERKRRWLRRVAKRKAIDQGRRTKPLHLVEDVEIDEEAPSAEQVALTQMALDRCLEVIMQMPPVMRRVAYLAWRLSYTDEEIAETLGIARSTVRVHRNRARMKLEEAIGDEMFFLSESADEDDTGREEER